MIIRIVNKSKNSLDKTCILYKKAKRIICNSILYCLTKLFYSNIKVIGVTGTDGKTTTTDFIQNNTAVNVTHNWTNAGKYTIKVKAYDNKAFSGSSIYTVMISAIDIQYNNDTLGYISDENGDGSWDKFHGEDVETNITKQDDGTYLIDTDGDGEPDYVLDPDTGDLIPYEPKTTPTNDTEQEEDNTFGYVIGAISIIFLISLIGVFTKGGKFFE